MKGRQLIHSQSAPERERPDAAPLAAGLHLAKSSSGLLERGQSVANSDGAKVPHLPRTPPNRGRSAVSSGGPGGLEPWLSGRRFPWSSAEMAAEACHFHLTLRGAVCVSSPHEGHAPVARGHDRPDTLFGLVTMGQWPLPGSVTDHLWLSDGPPTPDAFPALDFHSGPFPATTGSHGSIG